MESRVCCADRGVLSEQGGEGPVAAQLLWVPLPAPAPGFVGTAASRSPAQLYPQAKQTANPLKIESRLTGSGGKGRES